MAAGPAQPRGVHRALRRRGGRLGRAAGGRPLPAAAARHALRPRTASGRLSRPTVADLAFEQKELEAVFADLASYLAAGYQVLGLIVTGDLTRTKAGRAWLTRVQDLADEKLPTWLLPDLPELLEP